MYHNSALTLTGIMILLLCNLSISQGSRGGVTITEYDINEEDKTSLNATENETGTCSLPRTESAYLI